MSGKAHGPHRNLAKVLKVLGRLEPNELEGLDRFYMQGHDVARITADLGIPIARFRELRARVKQAYMNMEKPN